jgi:hypothetical protein
MRNNLYVEIRLKWNFSIGWRIFGVQVWGVCQRQKKNENTGVASCEFTGIY